jgi:hypothetical protein
MPMMIRRIETVGFMALGAERVALGYQLARMHIVTIIAGHAATVHLALQKRTHDEYFVVDLAVFEIESLVEQGQSILIMVIGLRAAISKRRTPRVTAAAGIDSRIADAA